MRSFTLGVVIGLAYTVLGCSPGAGEGPGSGGSSTTGTGGNGGSTASSSPSSGSEAPSSCGGSQDVSAGGTCPPDGYSGTVLPNGSELVVFKVDTARGLCVRWTFAANDTADPYGVEVTAPWSTTSIEATNEVGDCALDDTGNLAPAKGDSVEASAASGSTFVPVPFDPCNADVDATVFFQSEAPWAPEEEMFDSPLVTLRKCGPE